MVYLQILGNLILIFTVFEPSEPGTMTAIAWSGLGLAGAATPGKLPEKAKTKV